MTMRRMRLRFWLLTLDVIRACGGRMGSAAYVYALCKASDATDWSAQ